MNTYYIYDDNFKNSSIYKDYLKNNPSRGFLKIRAYSANEAIPIKGVNVTISKVIENNIIVFYNGFTDESGIIEKISLPAPKLNNNNLESPNYTKYEINTIYNNESKKYLVNIYENIYVTQTINIIPKMTMGGY